MNQPLRVVLFKHAACLIFAVASLWDYSSAFAAVMPDEHKSALHNPCPELCYRFPKLCPPCHQAPVTQ